MGQNRGGQKVYRGSSDFFPQPELSRVFNYGFIWRNVSTDYMKVKKKNTFQIKWQPLVYSNPLSEETASEKRTAKL